MAVTILKRKTKLKTKTKTKTKLKKISKNQQSEQSALEYVRSIADEAGLIAEKIKTKKQELKVLDDQYQVIVKPIQKLVDEEYNPATAVHGSGDEYTCTVSGKGSKSTITDTKRAYEIYDELGGEELIKDVMNFSVTDIKKYMTTSEQEEVMDTALTNARRITFTKS